MALASEDDVENALGRALLSSEDVTTLLESASDLVVGFLGHTPDPVPAPVARVVGEMVASVLTKPATNTADYGVSGYNVQRENTTLRVGVESATTSGPWLTKTLRMRLRPYRTAAQQAAFEINADPNPDTTWVAADWDDE